MKRLVACLIVLLAITVGCSSKGTDIQNQQTIDPDFRNVTWGMSKSDVKAKENEAQFSAQLKEDETLSYTAKLFGKDYSLFYIFDDNKLVRGSYVSNYQYLPTSNDSFEDYTRIKQTLIEKYGNPYEEKEEWKDEMHKDTPSKYGWAVAKGDVEFITTWKLPKTHLTLSLDAEKMQSSIIIDYVEINYKDKAIENQKSFL